MCHIRSSADPRSRERETLSLEVSWYNPWKSESAKPSMPDCWKELAPPTVCPKARFGTAPEGGLHTITRVWWACSSRWSGWGTRGPPPAQQEHPLTLKPSHPHTITRLPEASPPEPAWFRSGLDRSRERSAKVNSQRPQGQLSFGDPFQDSGVASPKPKPETLDRR